MTQRLVSSARPRVLTTSGKCGLVGLAVAAVFTIAAFSTTNWIQSDPRIYGSKLDRLGLWVHCFRSLADHNDPSHQKFFAGCRWIFDPFTEGYPDLKNFLSPRKFWNGMETKVLIKNYGEDSDHLPPLQAISKTIGRNLKACRCFLTQESPEALCHLLNCQSYNRGLL